MRRWHILRAPIIAPTPRTIYAKQVLRSLQLSRSYQQDAANVHFRDYEALLKPFSHRTHRKISGLPQYAIFRRIDAPARRVEDWAALLDGALPPHLREGTTTPPSLSTVDVAETLLAAQYPHDPNHEGFDLLFHLGIEKGRWNAVVWLIKRLVEKFPVRPDEPALIEDINAAWKLDRSLEGATNGRVGGRTEPLALKYPQRAPRSGDAAKHSLDELTAGFTDDVTTEDVTPSSKLQHNALGQVWRTLGAMTKACAGGDIRPEVLEIIAYLHHKEVMPMSIYNSETHPDPSAVQQPPLLSLLSSRILTSLSDAAWRAHEKLVVEQARAQGARYVAVRPEVPGSVYRVHVAGLRTEVWMELILWSCIHGGWIEQGAEILDSIHDDPAWSVISWREYARSMYPDNSFDATWEYAFKTGAVYSMDAPAGEALRVERTVSAEVINAYIDALACTVQTGVSNEDPTIESIISRLFRFKRLFGRSKSQLSLSTGSWDALILRLLDAQGVTFEANARAAHMLVQLSPGFGQGLGWKNTQGLPSYVLDGGMAMQGFLHRVLYGQIASGNYEGAVAAFKRIQMRTDIDKRNSLLSFMQGKEPLMQALSKDDLFTSNLPGIEYPAFDMQIPANILGSFLDLVTASKDYRLGRWLLTNNDLDGPPIKPEMYHDRFIQPAVIRFAAESNDQELLAKFKGRQLQAQSLHAVLDTQIDAMRWDAATRLLQVLDGRRSSWNLWNLARVARVMLRQVSMLDKGAAGAADDFIAAKKMFYDMCSSHYHSHKNISDGFALQVRNLLVVLAAIGEPLTEISVRLLQTRRRRYDMLSLNASAFNIVLSGVVDAYGSVAGRRLLAIFWPHSARTALNTAAQLSRTRGQLVEMPGGRPDPIGSERNRIAVRVHVGTAAEQELVLYGWLKPNSETILIVLRKALTELEPKQQDKIPVANDAADPDTPVGHGGHIDLTPQGMVAWAIRRLAELPYIHASVIEQIDGVLAAHDMQDLRGQLSTIVSDVERDIVADAEEANKATDVASTAG